MTEPRPKSSPAAVWTAVVVTAALLLGGGVWLYQKNEENRKRQTNLEFQANGWGTPYPDAPSR